MSDYNTYRAMARNNWYSNGKRRRTPFLLRLLGYPPYRQWFVRGPLSCHDDTERIWFGGEWHYYHRET